MVCGVLPTCGVRLAEEKQGCGGWGVGTVGSTAVETEKDDGVDTCVSEGQAWASPGLRTPGVQTRRPGGAQRMSRVPEGEGGPGPRSTVCRTPHEPLPGSLRALPDVS